MGKLEERLKSLELVREKRKREERKQNIIMSGMEVEKDG